MPPAHAPAPTHDDPPPGYTWDSYVRELLAEYGSWTALVDELIRRTAAIDGVPSDPQSLEKGLHRLARRERKPGGQYGRWLLRGFGVPAGVAAFLRWMGQYHSRFADLPVPLRHEQLRLWAFPPVLESRLAAWVHVGLASVLHRLRDLEACRAQLELARTRAPMAGVAAELEVALLGARVATDDGDLRRAQALLDAARDGLAAPDLDPVDRACYHARWVDQVAWRVNNPGEGRAPDPAAARRLYAEISADTTVPFVAYRRDAGLAFCTWKLGDLERARALARAAVEHAGDGGLVRLRVMGLQLLARMSDEPAASELRARAARLAHQLADEELLHRARVAARAP